jgi:glycosyltransferase involved in cell wall biosynthesis
MSSVAAMSPEDFDTATQAWSGAILLVGPLPPPSGGMANQTRQLARLLADEGCMVNVAQVNAPYQPAWVGQIRGLRALCRLAPYLVRLWTAVGKAELIHVMANSGWAWHLFAAPAIWIGHLRGKPVIVNYRGGDADAFFARQFRWVRPTLARASCVVVPSGFLGAVFAKYGVASTVVPNIVNLETFQPPVSRPSSPHLIVTRNLEPIYDIATAINAFAIVSRRHPEARLTIAGSGPSRSELERLAQELGVAACVSFTGRLDNAALPDLYRSASVHLNSSRIDNMPISLLEAMASGVPIASTRAGGIPYLVEHEKTGLLVPIGDHQALAAAALRLLDDPQLAARLAKAARQAVQAFSWPSVRTRLFAVYAGAIHHAPEPSCSC